MLDLTNAKFSSLFLDKDQFRVYAKSMVSSPLKIKPETTSAKKIEDKQESLVDIKKEAKCKQFFGVLYPAIKNFIKKRNKLSQSQPQRNQMQNQDNQSYEIDPIILEQIIKTKQRAQTPILRLQKPRIEKKFQNPRISLKKVSDIKLQKDIQRIPAQSQEKKVLQHEIIKIINLPKMPFGMHTTYNNISNFKQKHIRSIIVNESNLTLKEMQQAQKRGNHQRTSSDITNLASSSLLGQSSLELMQEQSQLNQRTSIRKSIRDMKKSQKNSVSIDNKQKVQKSTTLKQKRKDNQKLLPKVKLNAFSRSSTIREQNQKIQGRFSNINRPRKFPRKTDAASRFYEQALMTLDSEKREALKLFHNYNLIQLITFRILNYQNFIFSLSNLKAFKL